MVRKAEIKAAAGRLKQRIEAVRQRERMVGLAESVGLMLAVIVPVLAITMVFDNLVHLHAAMRILVLVGLIGTAAFMIRRAARLMSEPLTVEQVALKIERRFPQIDNRLINALLLAGEEDEGSL